MLEPDARDAGGYQGLKSAVDGGGGREGGREGCTAGLPLLHPYRWIDPVGNGESG